MKKKSSAEKQKRTSVLDLKKEFSAIFRAMDHLGWAEHGFGHCSLRIDDQSFLINEDGVLFRDIQTKNIVQINAEGLAIGKKRPASFRTHKILHRADQENQIVLHSHYAPVVVMANLGRLIYVSQYEGMLGPVRFLKTPFSGLHEENFAAMGEGLKGVKAVFCEQHGVFVFGKSLVEAFFRLYLVCRAAEVIVQSSALTDQPKTALELAWPKEQAIEMFWKNMKEQVS